MRLDIFILTEWLGPEGAVAGLEKSHLTNAELMMLARENEIIVDKKTPRKQIAIEIVMTPLRRVSLEPDRLKEMSREELQRYFADHMISTKEITQILEKLGIAPKGKLRIKLADFAASEISDLGMYQRVSRGKTI